MHGNVGAKSDKKNEQQQQQQTRVITLNCRLMWPIHEHITNIKWMGRQILNGTSYKLDQRLCRHRIFGAIAPPPCRRHRMVAVRMRILCVCVSHKMISGNANAK